MLLEAGIIFHSVFIGMAVSVATGPPFVVFLIAISFHQTFEGMALGSRIAAIKFPKGSLKPWLMVLAYGLTTPFGQAIGLAVHTLYDPKSQGGLLMVGVMNAISSGLLLFAGLVQLLAEDFLSEGSYSVLHGKKRVQAFTAVILGATLMATVGVSIISQALYVLVFCTRYFDIFFKKPSDQYWNFFFKIFYTVSSLYILFIMTRLFARTREREFSYRLGAYALLGSIILCPFVAMVDLKTWAPPFPYIVIDFSLILESVCILPQLLLLRQTTVPTVIDSYYLLALGAYRALYICNWIERFASKDPAKPGAVAVVFGIIQTLLYLDFAWVYYSRQRVKLRSGGVVDADDLNKSWLLRRVLRRGRDSQEDDEAARPALGDDAEYEGDISRTEGSRGRAGGWGRRGISVSADEDVLAAERGEGSPIAKDARMRDPDELARILHDEDDSDVEAEGAPEATPIAGAEWRDR
ncbi:hypothetical protein V492_01116 [Pseudogymnoascus sp. VKM F-4246]|nr:hypothetical protein V492_01116 [Pseudogymnoascus sp. VKM F-4246]